MNILIGQLESPVPIGDSKNWAEFGLAGLVIFALMLFIVFMYKNHREERKEWREEAERREDKSDATTNRLTDTVQSLTTAINTLSNQYRDECKYRHDRET